jgi:membrane associated rhomboid family serine protease
MIRTSGSLLKTAYQRSRAKRAANRHPSSSNVTTVSALTNSDPYENDSSEIEPTTSYQALEVEQGQAQPNNAQQLMIQVRDVNPSDAPLKYADYYADPSDKPKDNNNDDDFSNLSDEVYIVRQQHGYLSVLFSLAQTAILVTMMVQCGVAPLHVNPMVGPYPDVLSEWGAKNTVLILDANEYWRLLTPILLHAGVIHLICNVAVQLETGVFFEKEWGSLRWLIIYLTSAIGSSTLSCIIMPNSLSVGSSGAVMGLFGAKLSEVVLRACERVRTKQDRVAHSVRKEQCCVVSCSVVLVLAFSFIPYVDWAAHVVSCLSVNAIL